MRELILQGISQSSTLKINDMKGFAMTVASHIHSLEEKHASLETLLRDEQARPLPNFQLVQELKKQKLHIKEEINNLGGFGLKRRLNS